jgi:hypothetical protein
VTECEFSGLSQASCDHCRNAGKVARRPTVTARISGPIEARYRGVCRVCGLPYTPGTMITPSVTDGWVAECCAPEDGAA